ncbi:MAG: hypothetical protein HUJ75_08550 [Parasporobacterium sp.]|nr:hypothetical protein [Parasporobacterium sp.]
MKLKVLKTEVLNDYNPTGLYSSVTGAWISVDGISKNINAGQNELLVLVVDKCQKDLIAGAEYDVKESYDIVSVPITRVGGPSSPPWVAAAENEKATYYFRNALYVDGDQIDGSSVTDLINGGEYSATGADGVSISLDSHFNGILVDNGGQFEIKNSDFKGYGDGGDDLSGWGALVMADNKSNVNIDSSYMETEGATRCAIYVDKTSVTTVTDSAIYSKETPDSCKLYNDLVPAMMKRVPFALGMEGTVRSLNVMGDGQGIFKDSIIVSTGWGTISCDSGTAYDICGTYCLDCENVLSGIGTMEEAVPGKEYTAKKTAAGKEWGFTVGGSGYVTYADSGVHNIYKNVEFYSPDYIQIMGSGRSGSAYIDSYLYAEHNAFMTQQSAGGTFELTNTKVDTVDALLQIKSGAANTGFSNIIVDNSEINFSGTSTRSKDGILVELVESDDAGNPGITTYTINDHPEDAKATLSEIQDSSATFKNGTYKGDIYNNIYNYKQLLDVNLEKAELTGTISASTAIHVDLEGNLVPNGTVLNAFMGSVEYDHCNYRAEKGGMSGDCKLIGRFKHSATPVLNNPINVTLKDSVWNITGDGYLNVLTVDALSALKAETPVTLYVKALKEAGNAYADGTYKAGNVTVIVDSTEIEVEDNGIADAGQTYGNVVYTFYAFEEDKTPCSKAVTVKRQNFIDGNIYFSLFPAEGVTVKSIEAANGNVIKNTQGGELKDYQSVLCPENTDVKEMSVTITVSR